MSSHADAIKTNGLHLPDRRQVTALAYDLVGSTQLTFQLDPEDMGSVRRSFHDVCTKAVKRYEGYINGYAGDGAMAFFGYPSAHEDDAERAVKAGLEIVAACSELNDELGPVGFEVAVRVGIATGLVVAGGFTGDQAGGNDDIVGLAPNLAHKIQSAAETNSVVISTATYELVRSLFHLKQRPPVTLKEFAEPQRVWQVLKTRQYPTRYQAGRRLMATPLVSREEELATIKRRWLSANNGEGKVVLLSGEPGIGKSRLIVAASNYLAVPQQATLIFQCSTQYSNTPLQPVIAYLRRVLHMPEVQSMNTFAARISQNMRGWVPELEWTIPYIASLMSSSETPFPPLTELSSEQIKKRTLAALLALIKAMARLRPILLVVEDAHWIDPSSQELLDQLVGQARDMPILMVIAFRPSYQAPWIGQPHVLLMALNRLNSQDSALMVNHVVSDQVLPKDIVYRIITMADGVPLFIEELSHAIFHRKDALESKSFNIPATLSDSLTARLDQLGSKREIAQIASAIGRAFPLALLLKVVPADTANVTKAVNMLVALGLASITSTSYRDIYTFRHALIQESAYRSMTRGMRQAIHRQIAEVLEKEYAGTEDATPEILAHHYEESGQLESAIRSLKEAGRLAAVKSANVEATNLLIRALKLVSKLPESIARDELELSLLVALGPLQINTSGPGGPDTRSTYENAIELGRKLPHGPYHFAAYWGWWRTAPNFKEMHERANKISTQVAILEDDQLRLQAHHCQWATLFMLGNQRACCAHIADGLQIYENGDYRSHGVLYGGHDPKVCGLGEKGLSLWLLGYPEQSLQAAHSSLTFAESLQHAGSIGHGRDIEIMVHRYRGDPTTVLNRAETMSAFAQQTGSHDLAAKARIFRGWALSWLGEADDGVRLIHKGLDSQRSIGTQEDFPVYYEMLAESYGILNKPALALELIDEAFDMANQTGLQYWSAELLRRKGELLMQHTPDAAAEAAVCFKQATAIAEAQETRSLLLRIAMSQVRHRMAGSGETEAVNTLRSVYGSFTEGFDTTDLKQAGELLREVR